jgi:hypothetical protein
MELRLHDLRAPLLPWLAAIALTACGRGSDDTAAASAPIPTPTPVADTTPPTLLIANPTGNAQVTGNVSVTANATDNVGVVGVQFRVNGTALGAEVTNAPYTVSWNTASVSNGSYTLTAVARDAAGNQSNVASVTVTVNNAPPPDTQAPTVSFANPANGATVTGTIAVIATANDNVGVTGVQFRVDGTALGAEDTSAPYTASFNTSTVSNGSHTVTALARDAAGNQSALASLTVTVSNTTVPPTSGFAAGFIAHRGVDPGTDPAPLYVHFDATASTSGNTSANAFTDMLYEWDFGDPQSGNWETNGLPRNRAIGAVAGHVYDRSGNFTVTLTVTDTNGAQQRVMRTVNVDDPETVWSATTACVSASGNFTGCPGTSAADRFTSGDFVAAMNDRVSRGYRRILFRRGETFAANSCWSTPNNLKTEAMISAFGTGAQPTVQIGAANDSCAILLLGASRDVATSGGWRFVDFKITAGSSTNRVNGIDTGFVFDNVLVYKMDIGPTGIGSNFQPNQAGLNVPHQHYAVVDTQLRGNTGTPVVNSGTCWFGGADKTFISGVVCGQANFWQMRIAYTHKAIVSNNLILQNAGAYETIKLHCSIAGARNEDRPVCRYMIFSDNVLAERLNIAAGGGADGGLMRDSIVERNMIGGAIETENPGFMIRYNVATGYEVRPRESDFQMPRNVTIEHNVCDGRNSGPCVRALFFNPPALPLIYDGLVARNNLAWSPSNQPFFAADAGTSANPPFVGAGNRVVAQNPFAVANPNIRVRTDYVLRQGSPLIDAGVPVSFRGVDLLGNPTPRGTAPDVGAVEF